jgi:hypothetical protein
VSFEDGRAAAQQLARPLHGCPPVVQLIIPGSATRGTLTVR